MDLGDRYSVLCVLDADVVEESRVRTTEAGMRDWFERGDALRVTIEVGTHSPWVSRLRKSDQLDAEALARLARLDPKLLHGIEHRSEQTHDDLAIIRAREVLVRTRTRLINHVGVDSDLRRWRLARAARGARIAKMKAIGGVARKLAAPLHHLRISDEVYEPLRNSSVADAA